MAQANVLHPAQIRRLADEIDAAVHQGRRRRRRPRVGLQVGRYAPAPCIIYLKSQHACAIGIWLAKQYNANVTCSGDLDAMVPVIATKQSMEKLGLGVVADWRPWSIDSKDPEVSMHAYMQLPAFACPLAVAS